MMEDQLPDAFANRQYDTFVHVEVVDFERDAIDVAWVYPAGVETDSDTISPPATTAFYLAGATVRADADEFVCVAEYSLTRSKDDDRVIFRNVFK